jgi:fatty-acyl-CoA synthase
MRVRTTFLDVLAAHAQQTPDALALQDPSGSLTYGQMWAAIGSVARWLRAQGVERGDRVAIALPRCSANLVVLFAAMAAGAVAAPVNISLRRAEVSAYLSGIRPRLAIVGAAEAPLVDPDLVAAVAVLNPGPVDGGPLVSLGAISQPAGPEGAAAVVRVPKQSPAIMFGTGGTTGSPKAAAWSHEALWLYAASCSAAMEVRRTDVELFFSPLSHIALVTGPFGTLFSGGAVRILPSFEASEVAAILAEGEVTRLFGAPTALTRVIESPAFNPAAMGRVRRVLFGSTRSEPELPARLAVAFPNAELITGYGATEFGAVLRHRSWELVDGVDPGAGKPVPGVLILIVDDHDEILPPGRIGELVVCAPWQMLGYCGVDADGQRVFVHGGVRSGDLAERDSLGNIHLRGRLKDIVITGGENVYPVEVEDVLSRHPAVAEVSVVGVLDADWGERVEAAVVAADPTAGPSIESLAAFCRERLAGYKVPKRFHVVAALPLTSAMKVDKRALRELLTDA